MISIKLTDCKECLVISKALQLIDKKLVELAHISNNNRIFGLKYEEKRQLSFRLVLYKDILIRLLVNRNYFQNNYGLQTDSTVKFDYTIEDIVSRVRLLTHK